MIRSSPCYNKLIHFPFKKSAEKLYLKENIYDLILVLNYNTRPIIKNKGSAIFLHIATKENLAQQKDVYRDRKKRFYKNIAKYYKKNESSLFLKVSCPKNSRSNS